jgi:DNA ligase-1
MSEKLDGVRAVWNGTLFLSRTGNVYNAPPWFVEGLGPEVLDGELYAGRGNFQFCVSVVRRKVPTADWGQLTFQIFDVCSENVRGCPFEERIELASSAAGDCPFAEVVRHVQVTRGETEVRETLAEVERLGGEGLMLREPGSIYVGTRSSSLLKVKTFTDFDARVVGHEPGKGKHMGRTGALLCDPLRGGPRFRIGTGFTDAQRELPPAVGTVVSYKCQEHTQSGAPRFPVFLRERPDLEAVPCG